MFHRDVLVIDPAREAEDLASLLRTTVRGRLQRRGVVVGLSGGVDSAVTCALAARAVGNESVLAIMMPERDSSPDSMRRALRVAEDVAVPHVVEDIEPALHAIGAYRRYDDAVRLVVPEYGPGWKSKIALAGNLRGSERLNYFNLVARDPDGRLTTKRLPAAAYLQIVAANNFKQRLRKAVEYHHADRLHFAVAGTANRLEYDQGFFVKNGDGASDVMPIAHLYKSQVYAMAQHLGITDEICMAEPSTDTFGLAQTQAEFYFVLPYLQMDLLLWARNHDVAAAEVAKIMGFEPIEVERVYRDIERKRAATAPLHYSAILLKPVEPFPA